MSLSSLRPFYVNPEKALTQRGLSLIEMMVGLTIVNYGFPIVHLLATPGTAVPAILAGSGR